MFYDGGGEAWLLLVYWILESLRVILPFTNLHGTVGQETDLGAQKYYRNIDGQIWDDIGHTHFL